MTISTRASASRSAPAAAAFSAVVAAFRTEFPLVEEINAQQTLTLAQGEFRRLIDDTILSRAGRAVLPRSELLVETDARFWRGITDGHRLALCEMELAGKSKATHQVIELPRKGVLELQANTWEPKVNAAGGGFGSRSLPDRRYSLGSEADGGQFPEYGRVIPDAPPRAGRANREVPAPSCGATAILSNEKYRGIRLTARPV